MNITEGLAELFGAYAGDGSMCARKYDNGLILSIEVGREGKEWLDHLARLIEDAFCYYPKVRQLSESYRIQIRASEICEFFRNAGFVVGSKSLIVRAPRMVMEASIPIYKAFLRGYFDAEGCLSFKKRSNSERNVDFKKTHHYYPRIMLCSTSRDLIVVDIKYMLEAVNLYYSIYKKVPKEERKHENYNVDINGVTQLEFWMKEIGSANPVQFSEYEIWKRFGFCPPNTTLEQRREMLSGELDPKVFYKNNGGERARS